MKTYVESLAEDEVVEGLLCVLGEDGANNMFASMISDVPDDIRNPPESLLASFNEECGYYYSGTYYNSYRYSETFINEFVEDTKRRMPEFRNALRFETDLASPVVTARHRSHCSH
jgi:hypothetical protein